MKNLFKFNTHKKNIFKKFYSSKSNIFPLSHLTDEEKMLKEMVRKFANDRIGPKVLQMDEEQKMDPVIIKECFENGLMGLETEAEYGGSGMNFMGSILAIEELAKVDPSVSVMVDVQNTLVNIGLRKWGSESLKKKYLPLLAQEKLGCFCLSESGSGSDAFAMKTIATDKGDHYEIQGTKAWITNSGEAEIFVVFANVDPKQGYKGITAFVCEKGNPGLSIGKKENKLGIRASSTCEVIFDGVKVPKENILGPLGKGYKIAIESLNEGRIGIGAQMLGLAQGVFDKTMPYLNQRVQFGKPISSFQGMQFQFAEAHMKIEAARLMVYNAARLQENGLPFIEEASMAKLFASQVAEQVSSICINMMGGVGFTKDFGVEKYFRDSKIGQIYEGTTNIQLQTIAKKLIEKF
eukprot:TRINITY_DN2124_c0_g1_i2.p2 TRINITY_DN2124_c0_g1~~TRINITY_DN2124_c0_g1_i2.p2  ORF type:complete len:407 (+),score=136.27 TRINITY_DN2124_c0_g1_i2:1339-2559(+)